MLFWVDFMFKRYIDGYDKKLMKKKGFKYHVGLNKFVLDGYGAYLKDIDRKDLERYLNFFEEFGYAIVFGPIVSGNYVSNVGLYWKNYFDVLINKAMISEDIDSLVDRHVTIAKLKDQVGGDEYLEKIVIDEISFLSNVTASLDLDNLYKVMSNLNSILNGVNNVRMVTLMEMYRRLEASFYEKVIVDLDKNVDREKVYDLVNEAKCLAYDLQMTRRYPFLIVHNPERLEECAKEITGFVERVKTENSTSEIRGLLNGLKEDNDNYIEGTEYIVTILSGYAKNKTIEEYATRGKEKVKK